MSFQIFRRLILHLKPYMGRLYLAIFFSVIVGVISTSPVPLIQKTFDKIFVEKDYFMLKVIPLALIALYVVKAILTYAQNLIIFGISWELVVKFRGKLFAHIHALPFEFFEDNETGQLMSRINNDVAIMQSSVTRMMKEILQNSVMLIGLLIWVFYMKWDWAVMALIIFPVTIIPVSNIARKLRHFSKKGQEILGNINATILESFSGIKIVRAFGMEPREIEKFRLHNDSYLKVMKKNVKYVEITSPFLEVLGVVSAAFILWYGGNQVLDEEISQGTFLAFIVALFMMYAPIRILFKAYTNIQTALAGAERVFGILDQDAENMQEGQIELRGVKDGIEFKNVSFRYPSRSTMILNDINLSVKKSEIIAIVGMSGAGKTTLVDLLFRFFDATSGTILIDGKIIQDYKLDSLRKQLALVTQETFLFNDTIWNNISFGCERKASHNEIMEAAKAAHVDYFVSTLDDGYDTIIGERGVKLSGGQRQRIAIARAILRNAPILVLDEATSALDSESEKLVQDALHNLMEHRTSFVIAHRLSTIKHANRIIVLDKGKIVESGTHESLLASSGLYQKYYEMQIIDVDENNKGIEESN
ncbi:MAG: ATP-binding cassette domain-containing protein [Nitrospina sp.]|nr:ATP-binding cassette domain-containing protein [Nitrospina sp.]MBT3875759.1 ATP-binding cassette domain-containing protein [Nitrospina sp.]MBT4049206.1 ATP-binding cassette domain-containing protein [Nitrospina sp.]MBT4557175.1 ATP-binding cassette domain-containing protein [Nitrospina sp.]MBT5349418.1 ATP-binding cassette domain-containing protein [Nitrospina sp.]